MNEYIIHFGIYTLAMIGFIAIALYVYKKSIFTGVQTKDKDFLKIENFLKLSPTKNLFVIKAGEEKFLIAGDSNTTTLIAKLNDDTTE